MTVDDCQGGGTRFSKALASGMLAMFQWMAPQKKLDSGFKKKKKDMKFEGGVRWGRSRRD